MNKIMHHPFGKVVGTWEGGERVCSRAFTENFKKCYLTHTCLEDYSFLNECKRFYEKIATL